MKMMMMKIMMIFSSIVLIMNNPMSMGLVLLMQTTMVIIFMNKIMTSSWFSMITFMMMIGGLLIMFMYMSSIASNEKFKIKFNMIMLAIILIIIYDEMMFENQINENQEFLKTNNFNFSLTKIYNEKSMMLTIMLVMYLLLTMISVTKMVKHHKGPLRSIN
uniref:NADH dehydrogenase subunit 6 n=1 Tax=Aguriahana triangularis TaxID=2893144 RepID=A0A9E6XQ57_9HEMI|nr:NADH dehydrogenase subunit 6 [Aguriahana triangularis]UGN61339.1 NADH dehydrogenase subunit 6 [Aguriahana triangularis]